MFRPPSGIRTLATPALILCALGGAWAGLEAQIVPIKTVPVASGDQFLLFPSDKPAMGGVTLALADTLGDPFGNPATGSRIPESLFFTSPTYYGISNRNGSGRSLGAGILTRGDRWFGGAAASIQELESARREGEWLGLAVDPLSSWAPPPVESLSESSARNLYAFGYLGYRFSDRGLSVAVSGSYADLGAVDGVDLLYARSVEIRQSGHLSDLRLGVLKEWDDGRSLEVLLLRESLRMRHDVTYADVSWRPGVNEPWPEPQVTLREEENLDHTDTWGAHVAYRRPLSAPGWSIGWSLTTNRKDHPKIPNYEIQNIPRDPGDTWAHALGLGVAKTEGPFRFATDIALEPIRTDTWADAAADTTSVNGRILPAGTKTIENEFSFFNAVIRTGAAYDYRKATFSLGLRIRSMDYELDQYDHIQESRRVQEESWMEWTPSLGINLRVAGTTLRYLGRLTTGTGRPGTRWDDRAMAVPQAATDFILAPSGPLTLQDARVTTHQLSVVIPMR